MGRSGVAVDYAKVPKHYAVMHVFMRMYNNSIYQLYYC